MNCYTYLEDILHEHVLYLDNRTKPIEFLGQRSRSFFS